MYIVMYIPTWPALMHHTLCASYSNEGFAALLLFYGVVYTQMVVVAIVVTFCMYSVF